MKSRAFREVAFGLDQAWSISRNLFTRRPPRLLGRRSWVRPLVASIGALLAAAGAWAVATLFSSDADSWLKQALLERAWERSVAAGRHVKPWPWADAWPVARLTVPELGIERYVLSASEGAPGPGARHMGGTALPGEAGNSVIGSLQGMDLAFVRDLPAHTTIDVESMDGHGHRYTVRYAQGLDPRDVWITKQEGPDRLTLITCSPPRARRASEPQCYVVSAYAADGGRSRVPGPRGAPAGATRGTQAAVVIPAPVLDQAARSTLPQKTIFGLKTRV